MMGETLLEAKDLSVRYKTAQGYVTAVNDVSFTIMEDEYVGLVGESGCGKSTIAKAIMGGLDRNGEIASGKLYYKGTEIQDYSQNQLNKEIRWKEISFIPQNSMQSLNPIQTIADQAVQIMRVHTGVSEDEAIERLCELFEVVGLQEERIHDYPFQFSGGMAQRAIIAISLLLEPSMIIADEPTTALDVIMQDQIFKYIETLREETSVSLLLITHDISVVFELCDSIIVMYAGQLAEKGSVIDIHGSPRHPYTILLQQSFPDFENPSKELVDIPGYPPTIRDDVDKCAFADRCPWAVGECTNSAPVLESMAIDPADHTVACFRREEVESKVAEDPTEVGGP